MILRLALAQRSPLRIFLYSLMLFAVIELTLRTQQKLGPLYDLDFRDYDASMISEKVDHRPAPGTLYNEDGLERSERRPFNSDDPSALRVLFMGDSFIQGWVPDNTVPQYAWNYLSAQPGLRDRPLTFWNAGYSSYAPSIYTAQAKELIPKYRPDLVVVAIDETDLVDEFASYRHRLTFDGQGKIVGVRASEIHTTRVNGFLALQRIPFYSLRLMGMFYHKWIRMNYTAKTWRRQYRGKYYGHPLSDQTRRTAFNLTPAFDEDAQARLKYADEIAYFKKRTGELAQTLIELMNGRKERVLWIRHPHIYHLMPDPRGVRWKSYTAEVLEQTARQHGIPFYDMTEDMRREFGGTPGNFYFDRDMHFNFSGIKIYGELVAKKIQPLLQAVSEESPGNL